MALLGWITMLNPAYKHRHGRGHFRQTQTEKVCVRMFCTYTAGEARAIRPSVDATSSLRALIPSIRLPSLPPKKMKNNLYDKGVGRLRGELVVDKKTDGEASPRAESAGRDLAKAPCYLHLVAAGVLSGHAESRILCQAR